MNAPQTLVSANVPTDGADPQLADTVARLEAHFGRRVLHIAAPGGRGRASLRARLADMSVIATRRAAGVTADRESLVLQALAPHSDDLPRFLGRSGQLMFQSDVGALRLSQAAADAPREQRADLAAQAVAGLFRLHGAARKTTLAAELPHLGATPDWIRLALDGGAELARLAGAASPALDRIALAERLAQPGAQVLKWDCRAGNAALDDAGRLRWFDFEFAGTRHGAEDFAWLIGDEVWPLPADTMLDIVADAFDPSCGHARGDYLSYLALFATFHAIQRILLIVSEVRRRGWSTKARALRRDKVGTHPEYGRNACRNAAICADANAASRALVPALEAAERLFADRLAGR